MHRYSGIWVCSWLWRSWREEYFKWQKQRSKPRDKSPQWGCPFWDWIDLCYENNTFYLHGASEGKKVEVLNKNNNVCITISIDHKLSFRHETVACSYSMKYKSIVASGKAISIDDYDEKCRCLNLIMKKYVKKEFKFNPPSINNIKIFKIEIENITGKKF